MLGPGRGLGVKRMLSLCCGSQVDPGLTVSVLWLPLWEFQMWCSDPAEPASAHICFGADTKKRSQPSPEPGEETQAQHIC